MLGLCKAVTEFSEYESMARRIRDHRENILACPVAVAGLSPIHKAHLIGAYHRNTGESVVVICADDQELKRLGNDISAFCEAEVTILPDRSLTFYSVDTASREWELQRLRTLRQISDGHAPILLATPDALLRRTMPPEVLKGSALTVQVGKEYKLSDLRAHLVACGYVYCDRVEGVGQFAVRGGILDFFSPAHNRPVRVDFFGDEVDNMGFFDPDTQRRTENTDTADILPAAESLPHLAPDGIDGLLRDMEALKNGLNRKKNADETKAVLSADIERLSQTGNLPSADKYMALIYPDLTCALDYISSDTAVFVCETPKVKERIKSYLWQSDEDAKTLIESGTITGAQAVFNETYERFISFLSKNPLVQLESFLSGSIEPRPKEILSMSAKQLPSYGLSFETAAEDVTHYRKNNYSTVILASTPMRAQHLFDLLTKNGENLDNTALEYHLTALPPKGSVFVTVGSLSAGIEYPSAQIAVITEGQFTTDNRKKSKKTKSDSKDRMKIESYSDLSVGDLVVHEHHGIGQFVGIEKIKTDGAERDYIKIVYAGTDSLYVPATQLDLVSKYIGAGEDAHIKLNRLGGTEWHKAKSRAKGSAKDMAKKLISIYAERKRRPGFSFAPDDEWQKEFEDAFEYEETDAQLRSTQEIKKDMLAPTPMDRLLCGDVGFGKTEVAFRAVMKCILSNKQAAILVPTTVLARQHYLTALRRFSGYPVKIAILSRFQTPAETKEILRKLSSGLIDFVIGTHKLLGKDVKFHDLGLLIIDEEQRFGVTHKERLKEIAKNVDTLTMTATPIPRTLNMALSGIRDMSILEEAPRDRQPVQTYVLEHNDAIICDAIRREIARGGQVYYLHNRVENIDRVAARLKDRLGDDVQVAVAHGQMDETALNSVMNRMSENEVQVLVCTTIIETGIDIPNVNTLIIEDADKLGLAQLHQIRGRVGRSPRHAYAYLTYRTGKVLTEVGTKRLSAMREFAGFGSGFKIALRDLEIRGAGNLLGTEQSGNMISVGYDMYLKLLEEAVLEERGEKAEKAIDCEADLSVSAHIPNTYIPVTEERMDIYRRIAFVKTREDADDVIDELCDRYGDPPHSVMMLIDIAQLRGEAARAGISAIRQKGDTLMFYTEVPDLAKISALCAVHAYKGRIMMNAGEKPYISLKLRSDENPLTVSKNIVSVYARSESSLDEK